MRIAVVGAGALGTVYALRLSFVAQVTLVVRDLARAPKRIRAEKVTSPGPAADAFDAPPVSMSVPEDAEVVLLCVRADQVRDDLLQSLAHGGPARRIVVALTPLLPKTCERTKQALGARLVVGMPGVVAYEPDVELHRGAERRVRYWTPRVSPTALDARPKDDPRARVIDELRETLVAARLPCEVQPNVASTNAATTIAFFPLVLAIQAAGDSMSRLIDDGALLKLALDAVKESRALAKTVGHLARFSGLLLSFAGPFTVRAGVKLARARTPESLTFLERHFGSKLVDQNRAMMEEIEELARERGVAVDALRRLAEKAGVT